MSYVHQSIIKDSYSVKSKQINARSLRTNSLHYVIDDKLGTCEGSLSGWYISKFLSYTESMNSLLMQKSN